MWLSKQRSAVHYKSAWTPAEGGKSAYLRVMEEQLAQVLEMARLVPPCNTKQYQHTGDQMIFLQGRQMQGSGQQAGKAQCFLEVCVSHSEGRARFSGLTDIRILIALQTAALLCATQHVLQLSWT